MLPQTPSALYEEVARYPELFAELTPYQRAKVKAYAEEEYNKAVRSARTLFERNPGYEYPQEFRGQGREFEYWVLLTSGAAKSRAVLALANPTPAPVATASASAPALASPTPVVAASAPKLSLRQIALLCNYRGTHVANGERANSLAREHGHTSGDRLYKLYIKFTQTRERVNVDGRQVKPMIKDIEAVLPHLEGAQLQQATNELNTLKAKTS